MCSFRCWLYSLSVGLSLFLVAGAASAVTITATKVTSGSGTVFDATVKSAPSPQWPSAPTKYHNLPRVQVTPSMLGKAARGALGGPVGMAITAAMVASDWYFNQETGEFERVEDGEILTTFWASYNSSTSYRAASSSESCQKYAAAITASSAQTSNPVVSTCGSVVASGTSPTFERWELNQTWPNGNTSTTTYTARLFNGEYVVDPYIQTAQDEDYADALIAQQGSYPTSNSTAVQVLNNLISSTTPSQLSQEWPELQQAMNTLAAAIQTQLLHQQDPTTNPAPSPEQLELGEGLNGTGEDLPAFCTWASFLCEPFIGGDQPDVPMLDLEAPDYDSGLPSGGTCPQPYTFDTGFTGSIEISFQPACDLASAIRMPLLAISYLMAGFIVVGVRR